MSQPLVILATASYDHSIRFWEAKSGRCYRTIQYPDSVCLFFHFCFLFIVNVYVMLEINKLIHVLLYILYLCICICMYLSCV